MRASIKTLICIGVVATCAHSVADDYAIVGATLQPLTGVGAIDDATLIIADGKIAALGRNIDVPAGIEVIDGAGKVVTPGIFDPYSKLGLVEVSLAEQTVDNTHIGRFSAGFDIADAINPRSTLIGVNRIEGVTRALVTPAAVEGGFVIGGQAATIHLGGGDAFLTRRGAALVATLGEDGAALAGGSRAAALAMLREALDDAKDYNRHRGDYDSGDRREYSVGRLDLEALLPVVSGRTPLLVHAHRASDIEVLLRFKADYGVNLIIVGAAEGWLLADRLAEQDVAVIIEPLTNLPGAFERLNATLANAARLQAAGVTIAFASADGHNPRNLTQSAGNAVANGLPWEEGLRAITLNPARMFGHDREIGTLEVGKEADVVVWSGDPLEVTTFADHVFIRGEQIMMRSRQTLLRDRYLELDGDWPPQYRGP